MRRLGLILGAGAGQVQQEEWCADFAAWAWQEAGVHVTYGYRRGEINGAAVSFYEWGVAHGEWRPATGGYVADVVNGDGDRTGFSVVETGTDQVRADAGHGHGHSRLAGYVSPP